MSSKKSTEEDYIIAKKKVYHLKVFYIHLVGYFIVVGLLLYNLYIMEGPHADFFFWFDIIILVGWTAFIIIHGWRVFKGRILFKKEWETRKMKAYLEKENTKRWE